MPILDMVADKDGVFVLDAVYGIDTFKETKCVTILYLNGINIYFTDVDVFGNLEFMVSYDGKKSWKESYRWELERFMNYIKSLKRMTKEEVERRL